MARVRLVGLQALRQARIRIDIAAVPGCPAVPALESHRGAMGIREARLRRMDTLHKEQRQNHQARNEAKAGWRNSHNTIIQRALTPTEPELTSASLRSRYVPRLTFQVPGSQFVIA